MGAYYKRLGNSENFNVRYLNHKIAAVCIGNETLVELSEDVLSVDLLPPNKGNNNLPSLIIISCKDSESYVIEQVLVDVDKGGYASKMRIETKELPFEVMEGFYGYVGKDDKLWLADFEKGILKCEQEAKAYLKEAIISKRFGDNAFVQDLPNLSTEDKATVAVIDSTGNDNGGNRLVKVDLYLDFRTHNSSQLCKINSFGCNLINVCHLGNYIYLGFLANDDNMCLLDVSSGKFHNFGKLICEALECGGYKAVKLELKKCDVTDMGYDLVVDFGMGVELCFGIRIDSKNGIGYSVLNAYHEVSFPEFVMYFDSNEPAEVEFCSSQFLVMLSKLDIKALSEQLGAVIDKLKKKERLGKKSLQLKKTDSKFCGSSVYRKDLN